MYVFVPATVQVDGTVTTVVLTVSVSTWEPLFKQVLVAVTEV